MNPTSDENQRARFAATSPSEKARLDTRRHKLAIKHELEAIEQLAERISYMCAAERRLSEVIPGRTCDPDRLRIMRLALNSAAEALINAKRTSYMVDTGELGLPQPQKANIKFTEVCDPTMDGIDGFASDLGFIANSEAYMLGLISSRRRPDQAALEFMGYSIRAMNQAIKDIEGLT